MRREWIACKCSLVALLCFHGFTVDILLAWVWYFRNYQDRLPPNLYVCIFNAFVFWMDEFEVIIGLFLMSLSEVGNFYRTMCLIGMFPHCDKNERNLLLLKSQQ